MSDELKYMLDAILAFAVAAVAAFALSPLVKRFAQMVGAVDVPKDARRMHKKPITRLGGLAVFGGFLLSVLVFADISVQLRGVLLGAVMIVALGVVDDIRRLGPLIKFLVQIAAAAMPVLCGVTIEVFSNPLHLLGIGPLYLPLGALGPFLTVLWIVGITNSVNLIDGLDGLAVGVSTIASCSMLIIAFALQMPHVAIVMAALAGGCVGFMPYNLNPARMFVGDTGATFLGFILGACSIQGLFKFYAVISFAVPFLILGVPIFDTAAAIVRRVRKGNNPMKPDRSHVHHRLMDMGFSQKQSVAILYTMSAVLGLSAVVLTTSGELKALLLLLAVIAAVAVGAKLVFGTTEEEPEESEEPGESEEESEEPEESEESEEAEESEEPAEKTGKADEDDSHET